MRTFTIPLQLNGIELFDLYDGSFVLLTKTYARQYRCLDSLASSLIAYHYLGSCNSWSFNSLDTLDVVHLRASFPQLIEDGVLHTKTPNSRLLRNRIVCIRFDVQPGPALPE